MKEEKVYSIAQKRVVFNIDKIIQVESSGAKSLLTAHMHAEQLSLGEQVKGILSTLEFANIPLEMKKELIPLEKTQIQWKQMMILKNLWRPISLAIISNEHHKQNVDWWNLKQTGEEQKTNKGNLQTIYADWPLQAFIRGCKTSLGIKITYTRDENWEPSNWLEGTEPLRSSSYKQSNERVTITRDVSLKIAGGIRIALPFNKRCSDPDYILERWEE